MFPEVTDAIMQITILPLYWYDLIYAGKCKETTAWAVVLYYNPERRWLLALSLLADQVFRSIFEIDPGRLAASGIKLLLADLDNTLAAYGEAEPNQAVIDWTRALEAEGVTLFILSNNRKPLRAKAYARALDIPYIGHAGKPKPGSFYRAMEQMGVTREETAIVGDQIFTDIVGGKNAGVATLLVEPIRLAGNPGRYLRYGVEWPFRAIAKRRSKIV